MLKRFFTRWVFALPCSTLMGCSSSSSIRGSAKNWVILIELLNFFMTRQAARLWCLLMFLINGSFPAQSSIKLLNLKNKNLQKQKLHEQLKMLLANTREKYRDDRRIFMIFLFSSWFCTTLIFIIWHDTLEFHQISRARCAALHSSYVLVDFECHGEFCYIKLESVCSSICSHISRCLT